MTRYVSLQTAIQTVLQGMTAFAGHPEQVTLGDYRILDMGVSAAIVLESGSVSDEIDDQGSTWREWEILCNVFARYSNTDAETRANFDTLRDAFIAQCELYPSMNHVTGVLESTVGSTDQPLWVMDKAGTGAAYIMQTFSLRITRQTQLSGGEF